MAILFSNRAFLKGKLTHYKKNRASGFTLIEIIIVIVILSVLSIGSVQFISFSAQGYVDTARRGALASTANIANEKMTRLIREALPGSVRVNSTQSCIEFIPIIGATSYLNAPFDSAETTVSAVNVDNLLSNSGRLAIYPVVSNVNELYTLSGNKGYISTQTVNGVVVGNEVTFTFDAGASFQFESRSPQKRVYIVDQPNAFCQIGSNLFYFQNYGFVGDIANLSASLPTTISGRLLIANQLSPGSLRFRYLPSSLRRNAIVSYELELRGASNQAEVMVINQEVQIRNVP
ncbi:MAG: prepilin-type N-terminal cleavage/methylation domain-containing protein [Bermanella sp.]